MSSVHFVPRTNQRFTTNDGTSLYYEIHGEGPPLVLVYGIACLINHYHHQIEYFSKNYSVIALDLRGHNQSQLPKDLSTMKIENLAQDLEELLDHLNLPAAHFVGHSFGVPLLLNLAAKSPKRCLSLTFINGFAKNPIKGMFGVDLPEKIFYAAKFIYRNFPGVWTPLFRFAVLNPVAIVGSGLLGGFNLTKSEWKDLEIYARAVSEMSLDMFIPLFESMMNFNGESLAKKITTPALVLAGDQDFVTPIGFQKQLHEMVGGSRFVAIPKGSHCTQLDFPELVNSEIEKHLIRALL